MKNLESIADDLKPPQGMRLLGAGDVASGLMELVTLRQTELQLTEWESTQRRHPQVQMFAGSNGL